MSESLIKSLQDTILHFCSLVTILFCAGVKPEGENWSEDSAKTFQKSVVGLKLLAKAIGRTKHGYCVQLVAVESGSVIADVLIAAKVAIPDEKSVKEKIDVNNNKALRPPRNPLLTSKILPVLNSDKGAQMHKELLSPRICNSSPPSVQLRPMPSILRDAHPTLLKTPKGPPIPNAVPRDLVANPPGGRELHSSNLIPLALNDVRLPKSIPSAAKYPAPPTHTTSSSNNPSSWGPKDSNGPKSTSPYEKAHFRTPNTFAPRGGLSSKSIPMEFSSSSAPTPVSRELRPSNLSSQKEIHQAKSIPATSRESRFTNSTPLIPSRPHLSAESAPIPGASHSQVSSSTFHNQLLQASSVDSGKPNSHHPSRDFQFSNSGPSESTSSAERGVHPDHSSPSNKSVHGGEQVLNNTSVHVQSAASQHLSGKRRFKPVVQIEP